MKLNKLHKKVERSIQMFIAFIWAFIAVFPLWWITNIIFSPSGAASSIHPTFFPTSLSTGIKTLISVVHEGSFINGYLVSLSYAGLQTLGVVLIVSMAAFEFSHFTFPGKKLLFILALSSLMIPLAVTIIPAFRVLVAFKWLNTIQGLAVPGMASAQALLIITQFMESIPGELMQSADIDGASHFKKYFSIILPNSRNALVTAGLLTFINAWGNFIWPLTIITKQEMYPVSLIINSFVAMTANKTLETVLGALFLAAIVPIILYAFFQKYIVKGIASTGIKG